MTPLIDAKETCRALNDLARHQMIRKLLADIMTDLMICEIEGWDRLEYLNMLKCEINALGERDGV